MSQSGDSDDNSLPSSLPSSPPDLNEMETAIEKEKVMVAEEERAEEENKIAEERRKKLAFKKRSKKDDSKEARDEKAAQLNLLLSQTQVFSQALTKKTQVLGRVGSGFDDQALGEHNLAMAKQPKNMVGGTMRGYQLEGLTWMLEICEQGLSGILADEMGLGKTIQTISLIALLREKENYLGPHLIVAPLSTLSNWEAEFEKWTPSVPIVLYHGNPTERQKLAKTRMFNNLPQGRPNLKFPIVLTSPEIVMRDEKELQRINWEMIIIDEGHRMKNSDSKLFRILKGFHSATRLLITGTPLQNNLKELWSLLNFLLPNIFTNWDQFESWFDFSELEDEVKTKEFLADKMKQDLVKKMHVVLQPLLLRRVKADVEHLLPKKREYVLFAPMTKEQTDLYRAISDKTVDTRKFLEDKAVAIMSRPSSTAASSRKQTLKAEIDEESSDNDMPLALRQRRTEDTKAVTPKNAFQAMMAKKTSSNGKAKAGSKRKAQPSISPASKSAKSSRQSTPASTRSTRSRYSRKTYEDADPSDEDDLSDDAFEAKIAAENASRYAEESEDEKDPEEIERFKTLELAKKEVGNKKLGNPVMQLRLACNSPHNFFNPWAYESGLAVDETLVTASGKMILLDRLLPALFGRGHKVLIFSQFNITLDLLQEYATELRGWEVCRIDGSIPQVTRRNQINNFNKDPELKLFLLSTRAGGQGINLASADTVILFDSDWNPQLDLQAQDRAHRIGQTRPVVVFRLATKGTVEEKLLLDADAKRRLEKIVIKKGGYKSMNQKLDNSAGMTEDALKDLLLKDGEVFKYSGKEKVLSDEDLDVLCDRSDAAFNRASQGLGNASGYRVVESKVGGIMETMGKPEKQ